MSEKDDRDQFEELQRKMREAMGNADLSSLFNQFGGGGAGGGSSQAASSGEDEEKEKKAREESLQKIREFSLRPREVRDYLDRFVIRQDEAKKVLSVAICDHFNHVRRCIEKPDLQEKEYAKQNIILLGPTGVGKTYLMRCIARLIGVPFVKADATKFSETGYVGHDVEDLVRDLVKAADGDTELAQYGIIYIDEIDKIAGSGRGQGGRDVSGRGVQINLLKLMEETDVSLFSQTDIFGQMQAMMEMQRGGGKSGKRTINTRHILFIVSGAFDNLNEQVRERVESGRIGFGSAQGSAGESKADEYLHRAETEDFIRYGFEPEFIGRLPVRVTTSSLDRDDLEEILNQSEGSILRQYRDDFNGYGIDLDFAPEAIREVAGMAAREKTGARALMTILERVFRNFKFELPSTSIREVQIDEVAVKEPQEAVRALLKKNASQQREVLASEVDKFASRFHEAHGLTLKFRPEAIEALVDLSIECEKTIRALCEARFHDFEHGLKLIARNTGRSEFTIEAATVREPDRELSRWIVESFREEKQRSSGSGSGEESQ